MLFNTIEFLLFLPLVVMLYYLTPQRYRWALLLIASYYFYMSWKVEYIFLIIISTLVDYWCGLRMSAEEDKQNRKPYLIFSLISNLGLLFSFKYFNFVAGNLNELFASFSLPTDIPLMKALLPVGISFYTFQTLSYSIDVYKGEQKAEKHLGQFALYVSYFPQLVAGPIERFSRLNPQLKEEHPFTYDNLSNGLRLMLYGFFIKMVIADNLSIIVDKIYEAPQTFHSWDILLGLFCYSFQIYGDFFGYSIIAIGTAKIMGVDLMDNFKTPYLAKNIGEFWQRWHISLSTWFRDYIYYPLGGNRSSKLRWSYNILVVFIVSGIWHGANWTFILWGTLYGFVYLVEKNVNELFRLKEDHAPFSVMHILLALKTFIAVTLIWVFFRSQSFTEAMQIFSSIFRNWDLAQAKELVPMVTWIMLGIFILSDLLLYNSRFDRWVGSKHLATRWTVYSLMIFCVIAFSGVENFTFIYFQF
jgi:D-alanyl-lipoteichoic acid acyltransferase DltB (MBOAT superfamily)